EAFAARRAGDAVGARTVLDDAVAQRPGFLHALGYLGEDRLESRDNASAKVEFERFLKRAPGHPWAQAQLAHALARLGKKNEALQTDGARTRAIAQADLARVAALEGNLDEAVQRLAAARDEGMRKLPCDEPAFAKWKGKPDFDEACKELAGGKPGVEPFDENE